MAGLARRRRQAAGRLFARPDDGLERHAQGVGEVGAGLRPARAGRLQAMIDGDRGHRAARAVGPGLGQQEGGQGIAAAGEGHGDGAIRMRIETPVERLEGGGGQAGGRRQAAHLARARAAVARVFTAALALG